MTSKLLTNVKNASGDSIEIAFEGEFIIDRESLNQDHEIIDGGGHTVLPGLVDLHTHLREPGREDAETVLSGSRAAVAGGFTTISAMPNTNPVADTAGVVEQVYSLGRTHGLCAVQPIGAVTVGQRGETLSEMAAMNQSAAKVRIFSDDGHCVFDPLVMRRALEYVRIFDGVIAQHAQDPKLTQGAQMNEGLISSKLGLKGWPAVAEESIIARDVLLADHVGSRLHICHVSTAGSVEIVRWAKARGISVTAEVTPHHLLLTDELTQSYDPVFKVNPPLRSQRDVQALREGLADGTIDIIATDHAPHPQEAKECEWSNAAFGMLGLETAFSVSYLAMVDSGMIDLGTLLNRMSTSPAAIARYPKSGSLEVGNFANFFLVDLDQSWQINVEEIQSKSRNTPFLERKLPGRVSATFFKGRQVFGSNRHE